MLVYIDKMWREGAEYPSYREMAKLYDVSTSSISYHMDALVKLGYVRKNKGFTGYVLMHTKVAELIGT